MDNEMIVDFINSVEPDFSYGTSDGMSRAMVESAENIARINDYITESFYEVYTESDDPDKPGFFSKLSNKEIKDYNYLVDTVSFYDDQNSKVQWSSLKKWFPLLLKTCEYVENSDSNKFSKADKRIWKEIKEYVG